MTAKDNELSYEDHQARLYRVLSVPIAKAVIEDPFLNNCFNVAVRNKLSAHKMLSLMVEKLYEKSTDLDKRLLKIAMNSTTPAWNTRPNTK